MGRDVDHLTELTDSQRTALAAGLAPLVRLVEGMATVDIEPIANAVATVAAGLDPFQRLADSIAETLGSQFAVLVGVFEQLGSRPYPENWDGVERLGLAAMVPILLDEGIPLMWVPSAETLKALTLARSAADRRRTLGRRWRGVLADCASVLNTIDHPRLIDGRAFAINCADALRAGHHQVAQALAANLLDSLLRGNLDAAVRTQLTRNTFRRDGSKIDLDAYEVRMALTFAPVWHAYAQYRTEHGDRVPRAFGRHPSAHAVSRAQYTRINAVIALMLVTSVLRFLDAEMDR